MSKQDRYEPSPPVEVSAHGGGDVWTLVFVRELRHTPDAVWEALTNPAQLKEWAPFVASRDLGSAGAARITMIGEEAEEEAIEVRAAERPKLLEYTWGTDLLRWELQATAHGTRLTLHHSVNDKSWLPKVCTGWHVCLDVADRLLQGRPIARSVVEAERAHGWNGLYDAYVKRLGLEPEAE